MIRGTVWWYGPESAGLGCRKGILAMTDAFELSSALRKRRSVSGKGTSDGSSHCTGKKKGNRVRREREGGKTLGAQEQPVRGTVGDSTTRKSRRE